MVEFSCVNRRLGQEGKRVVGICRSLALVGLQRGAGLPGGRQAMAAEGQLVALLGRVQAHPRPREADADLQDARALHDLNCLG